MKKIFAIGDIHGCKTELVCLWQTLLHDAKLNPEKDIVVFMGDYVDRGPDAKGVIDFLMNLEKLYPHFQFLYGNHEDLMLDALIGKGAIYHSYDLWYQQGGKETAKSYFPEGMNKYDMAISQPLDHIIPQHLKWLNSRPVYFEYEDFFFVHGGLVPTMTIEEHKNSLQLGNGDVRKAMLWAREEFYNSNYDWGKTIIFGHTAFSDPDPKKNFRPFVKDNLIGIDTAPMRFNGRLTALQLPERVFYFQDHCGNINL